MQLRFGRPPDLGPFAATRARVREFLDKELAASRFVPWTTTWTTFDAGFSRRAGEHGFIGMTWPRRYGGGECSALERYVVVEEMLAAGAPCGAHWIADRQSGPQILSHGSQRARDEIIPRIVRGECSFGIGMSEPDSGSDLAAVRTRAVRVDGGWRIHGTKVWTTNAHQVDYLIALVRTDSEGKRHAGLTQMIVATDSPGIAIRPIRDMTGNDEFNEVHFDGCFVPDDMLIGAPGEGWKMVTSELSLERSGPDRFLSALQLLLALVDEAGARPDAAQSAQIGRLVAHLVTLRSMSTCIAQLIEQGQNPMVEAALIKDLGTSFEREIPEVARLLVESEPARDERAGRFANALAQVEMIAPSFTLRGGTREVLRGILARAMDLR
jgi:alkylation response protein AidB-like acyl-CoA dehydrogenase